MVSQAARLAPRQRDLGRAMRAAEERARALVEQIPSARSALKTRGKGRKYVDVDALERAVTAGWKAGQADPSVLPIARAARAAWAESVHLRNELALSARGMARSEARRLAPPHLLDDAMQEAQIGLVEAAKRYDPDATNTFTTYAAWWVRARLRRAIGSMATPVHISSEASAKLALAKKLRAERDWTDSELAAELRVDVPRIREILAADATVKGLDDDIGNESRPAKVHDVLADETAPDEDEVLDGVDQAARWREVESAMATLSERERYIVARRYGLDGRDAAKLEEIGRELGLSRERVRQIQMSAMHGLKAELGIGWVAQARRERPLRDQALAVLAEVGTATAVELGARMDVATSRARSAMQAALRAGLVHRVAPATYALLTTPPPPKGATVEESILADLADHPWSTSAEIAERHSLQPTSVSSKARKMLRKGRLQRVRGEGGFRYALVEAA